MSESADVRASQRACGTQKKKAESSLGQDGKEKKEKRLRVRAWPLPLERKKKLASLPKKGNGLPRQGTKFSPREGSA